MAEDLVGKLPPQNLEAEQSVLGSLLIDRDAIIRVSDFLTSDDFYADKHRIIYEAMIELYRQHEPIDALSLANRLTELGKLDLVGGRSYLTSLTTMVPTSSHVVSYAHIVQKKATLRRLIETAADITKLGYDEGDDTEQILDRAEQRLFSVSQKYIKRNFVALRDVLSEAFERIDEVHRESGKLRGVPTGFHDLDNLLGGLQNSDLVVLAARPSVGKTSLALDILRNVATSAKVPVGLFSLEMSKEQMVDRLLCATANVDLWKMRTGHLSDEEDFKNIGHAMGVLSEAPIYIDDSANANVMEIRTKARRLQAEHGVSLLIIDYLQLMQGRDRDVENRVQEVSEITRELKGIARELNIPVLALSQLSRAVETQNPPIPRLAHLRESGSIEQDADIVMFIYRESVYKRDLPPERRSIAEIHIAKHRNGPTGVIQLHFNEARASFNNLEKGHSINPPF
ncbi:MAG: replicative DNA helicase [Patescibacteria group bacterium]|jgi:replicative DNA helicase